MVGRPGAPPLEPTIAYGPRRGGATAPTVPTTRAGLFQGCHLRRTVHQPRTALPAQDGQSARPAPSWTSMAFVGAPTSSTTSSFVSASSLSRHPGGGGKGLRRGPGGWPQSFSVRRTPSTDGGQKGDQAPRGGEAVRTMGSAPPGEVQVGSGKHWDRP